MKEQTIRELKHLIATRLDMNLHEDQIQPDVPLLADGLKLDSLAIVELITLSEERFGIEFAEDDLNMEAFANLGSLADVIVAHREKYLTQAV